MRFQVPQFIEVEDKIFGPLTFKQFLYILGGAGLSFIIWSIFKNIIGNFLAIILVIPVAALFGAFAFYKIQPRQPFIETVQNALNYYLNPKLYIWKHIDRSKERKKKTLSEITEEAKKATSVTVPRLSESKLQEMSWGLDVQETISKIEDQTSE